MVNRHDLDSNLPRTSKEILALNQAITYRLQDAFYLKDNKTIPIIPCIGNKTPTTLLLILSPRNLQ